MEELEACGKAADMYGDKPSGLAGCGISEACGLVNPEAKYEDKRELPALVLGG
jgi:hypothetical protein